MNRGIKKESGKKRKKRTPGWKNGQPTNREQREPRGQRTMKGKELD